ncbi:MAG: ATPase, T2SS/T4P/T4SS family [Candidatus Eremiobacteraeota bacterium]|nr:ATPase, T2SS/T4P/T4SS family [Candidatus Eremiobacteraeota bacterium]
MSKKDKKKFQGAALQISRPGESPQEKPPGHQAEAEPGPQKEDDTEAPRESSIELRHFIEELNSSQATIAARLGDIETLVEKTALPVMDMATIVEGHKKELEGLTRRIIELEKEAKSSAPRHETGLEDNLHSTLEELQQISEKGKEYHKEHLSLKEKIDSALTRFDQIKKHIEAQPSLEKDLNELHATAKLMTFVEQKIGELPEPEGTHLYIETLMDRARKSDLYFTMENLLDVMITHKATVLHLRKNEPPQVKVEDELIPVGDKLLTEIDCAHLILPLLTREQQGALARKEEVVFTVVHNEARFKINVFFQSSTPAATIKMHPLEVPPFNELMLPEELKKLIPSDDGLVIFAGLNGSGKTTTAAACIDFVNSREKKHIITLESPIEYEFKTKQSLITQRELGTDFTNINNAFFQSLSKDPDIIFIGEITNPDMLMNALLAADSGHLVMGTLMSPNCIKTVEKMLEPFAGEGRHKVQNLIARTLKLIVTTELLTAQESGKVPALEIMVNSPEIARLILENRLGAIYSSLESASSEGMRTFAHSISQLLEQGVIAEEEYQRLQLKLRKQQAYFKTLPQ